MGDSGGCFYLVVEIDDPDYQFDYVHSGCVEAYKEICYLGNVYGN